MPFPIYVTSKSNKSLIDLLPFSKPKTVEDIIIVDSPPTIKKYERTRRPVIAIGGGSVIDTAKIISGNNSCIAIPTTASGSAVTSWAVLWGEKERKTINTKKPILCDFYRNLSIKLNAAARENTYYDCAFHISESRFSVKVTADSISFCNIAERFLDKYNKNKKIGDLIEAGNYAGRAIEITGTNKFHAMSYVLTLEYGIPHGESLKCIALKDKRFDWADIDNKARKYKKYYEYKR